MAFNYWVIVKKLLEIGLPWDVIDGLSEDAIGFLLAMEDAIATKEADTFADKKFL